MASQPVICCNITGIDIIFSGNTIIDHNIIFINILMMDLAIQYNYI